jgi:3-phosphoshikimate 1-carboxyvinyltransferase
MKSWVVKPAEKPLIGYVNAPGDKSIGHRALMFGALADGAVRITGLSDGVDNRRTRSAMAQLGAAVREDEDAVVIEGVGVDGLRAAAGDIDCGNSGTTMRLLCGLLAGQGFASRLVGDESLSRRPMRRISDPLAEMGARISGAAGAVDGQIYPPLEIAASAEKLRAIEYRLPMASAQVKSAVLLAGLYADGLTRVIEPGSTRDHTERMLASMGAPITVSEGGVIEVDPGGWDRRLAAGPIAVPADPSAAAFLLAAGVVAGAERVSVGDVCTNRTRTGFLDVLASMNVLVERQAQSAHGEPVADLCVSRGAGDDIRATRVDGDLVVRSIDELPILAVVAARAQGETVFADAGELRVKESDRIATTVAMLRGFDIEVEENDDGFVVHGKPQGSLSHTRVDAAGDHRIAMSAAVAALVANGPSRIDNVANVDTSFPGFVEVMATLGAEILIVEE